MTDPLGGPARVQFGVNARRVVLAMLLLALTAGKAPSQGTVAVTLAWDANPERVAGYYVHVGTQSGEYSETYDAGNKTTYRYDRAVLGRRYYFAVSAYAQGGLTSPMSDEVTTIAGSLVAPPPDPPPFDSGTGLDGQSVGAPSSRVREPEHSVRAQCGGGEGCYAVRVHASGLQSLTSLSVSSDGHLLAVEDSRRLQVIAAAGSAAIPALSAAPGTQITDVLPGPEFATTHHVFVGVMQTSREGTQFAIIRYRWMGDRMGEAARIVAGLSVSGAKRPRMAIDHAGRIYVALPATETTRDDPYAGAILRFNSDGTVPDDNHAASPVFAHGFEAPTALVVDGQHLWAAGTDSRWTHVLGRLPLEASTGEWPLRLEAMSLTERGQLTSVLQVVAVRASSTAPGADQLLAYIDVALQLHVVRLSGGVQRRVDLADETGALVPEAVVIGPAGQIFVAARGADDLTSVIELITERR